MTPRQEALAYRIYCYCAPLAWDLTHAECAAGIGESCQAVSAICRVKRWNSRFRVTRHNPIDLGPDYFVGFVGEIGGQVARREGAE